MLRCALCPSPQDLHVNTADAAAGDSARDPDADVSMHGSDDDDDDDDDDEEEVDSPEEAAAKRRCAADVVAFITQHYKGATGRRLLDTFSAVLPEPHADGTIEGGSTGE